MISAAVILFKCWLESTTFCGRVGVFIFSKIQLVVYYQYCVQIG